MKYIQFSEKQISFTFNINAFCPSRAFYCNTSQKKSSSETKKVFQEKHQFNFHISVFMWLTGESSVFNFFPTRPDTLVYYLNQTKADLWH